MAKIPSKRTLGALANLKKEFDHLELSILGDMDPTDAEMIVRVLRILNDKKRRTDFLIHFVMEFNEGSITITPPPPTATDSFPPPGEGEKIIVEPSEASAAKRCEDTELLKTGQPLTFSRGLAHRDDGVHVEVLRRADSSGVPAGSTEEDAPKRLQELQESIKKVRAGLQPKTHTG